MEKLVLSRTLMFTVTVSGSTEQGVPPPVQAELPIDTIEDWMLKEPTSRELQAVPMDALLQVYVKSELAALGPVVGVKSRDI